MANATVTSPVDVANAIAKHPMFFMRVHVDQPAAYFTFNNSIPYANLHGPGNTHPLPCRPKMNRVCFRHACSSYPICASAKYEQTDPISSIQAATGWPSMLHFNPVQGGNNASDCIHDSYFMVDRPNAPQALGFGIIQTFGGKRRVWCPECNFSGSGKCD